MVHIVTSSSLRRAKAPAEQIRSLPRAEMRGAARLSYPSVNKKYPIFDDSDRAFR
jgi:hypothetical protein